MHCTKYRGKLIFAVLCVILAIATTLSYKSSDFYTWIIVIFEVKLYSVSITHSWVRTTQQLAPT